MTNIIRNAVMTPDGTYLRSYHRHDYRMHIDTYSKERYFVDGGNSYIRRSQNIVPPEDLTVTTDDDFDTKIRYAFVWKSYGIKGEHLPDGVYIALCDMEEDHIRSILNTQKHVKGTYMEELFKKELEYRIKKEY